MQLKETLIPIIYVVLHSCSTSPAGKEAIILLTSTELSFGTISYKKETTCFFEFTNPGYTLLVISNIEFSCGCTAANWTKEPVKPGKSGQIMIKYDAGSPGIFHKTIKVHYNGKDSPAILKIKGQVAYPEDLEDSVK